MKKYWEFEKVVQRIKGDDSSEFSLSEFLLSFFALILSIVFLVVIFIIWFIVEVYKEIKGDVDDQRKND